ncbi:XdhC family protein [Nocardioides sp. B-3]|uniref:XdhC family protein n=1 Tax=Nocardioides sp. B-3 TaxID=2895565 RepID=UPI002152B0E9|nr:XdhC family protein [Nocardioides sp. B-3]UUZ57936.1 XdhC family protein [Nocardioides sp. B-3]
MVVSSDATWGSIGGGNPEETAVVRARALLSSHASDPEQLTPGLTDKTRTEHGRQCCGGEVTVLLEPLAVVPAVAIFGVGHVGLELARIPVRHDLDLHPVDSRRDQLAGERLACLDDGQGAVHVHHSPVPEVVLGAVPAGTHVLVMTHDHAEDFAICDAALRCGHLGSVGLIGSAAKWARFRSGLLVEGHDPGDDRTDPQSHRRSGARRQGAGHDRGLGGRRPAARSPPPSGRAYEDRPLPRPRLRHPRRLRLPATTTTSGWPSRTTD